MDIEVFIFTTNLFSRQGTSRHHTHLAEIEKCAETRPKFSGSLSEQCAGSSGPWAEILQWAEISQWAESTTSESESVRSAEFAALQLAESLTI